MKRGDMDDIYRWFELGPTHAHTHTHSLIHVCDGCALFEPQLRIYCLAQKAHIEFHMDKHT